MVNIDVPAGVGAPPLDTQHTKQGYPVVFRVSPNRPGDGLVTRIPPYSLVKAPATLRKLLTVLGV